MRFLTEGSDMVWHDKINSKQNNFKASSIDHKPKLPLQTTATNLLFSNWVAWLFISQFHFVFCILQRYGYSFIFLHCVACAHPLFIQCFYSFFVFPFPPIQSKPGWSFNLQLSGGPWRRWADDTVYSHLCSERVRGGTTGAHSKLCHCPPEQTQFWRSRGRVGVDGEEAGWETRNQLMREGWQSDSQCKITLTFRFGPSERSFWTHLCLFLLFFFFSFFGTNLRLMETHSCHASLPFTV